VEYLLMPKAIDFTSISMRIPGLPRVEQKVRSDSTDIVYNAHCVPGRLSTPCFAVERGRGRGIEGLPLLVREAAHHGRGVFAVGEEACSDGLTVYPVAEAAVPPREPCLSRGSWRCRGLWPCSPSRH
jgi:hypothetical protein